MIVFRHGEAEVDEFPEQCRQDRALRCHALVPSFAGQACGKKIREFITGWNKRKHPFVWTKTPEQVLAKAKPKRTSETRHSFPGAIARYVIRSTTQAFACRMRFKPNSKRASKSADER